MKITKKILENIIKEEINTLIEDNYFTDKRGTETDRGTVPGAEYSNNLFRGSNATGRQHIAQISQTEQAVSRLEGKIDQILSILDELSKRG